MNLENEFDFDFPESDSVDVAADDFVITIAENISKAMREAGIKTKVQLAKKLGKTPAAVTQLLTGVPNITARRIAEVAVALGTTTYALCAPRKTVEMIAMPLIVLPVGGVDMIRDNPKVLRVVMRSENEESGSGFDAPPSGGSLEIAYS